MFWRPAAAFLAIILAVGVTALVLAYFYLAHDLGRPIQIIIAGVVYIGSAYVAMVWMLGSGSLKVALHRTRVAAQALVAIALALAALWALGFFDSGGLGCSDCEAVRVSRIIDGDTLDTSIGRIRLYGIDAPEIGERCSRDATEELRRLAGNRVMVEDGPRLVDRFGRRLAYLYRVDGQSIDAALISGGYAVAWTRDGQHKERLAALESEARGAGKGCLWQLEMELLENEPTEDQIVPYDDRRSIRRIVLNEEVLNA